MTALIHVLPSTAPTPIPVTYSGETHLMTHVPETALGHRQAIGLDSIVQIAGTLYCVRATRALVTAPRGIVIALVVEPC